MKKINLFYWIFTGLFSAMMLFTAIPDVISSPDAVTFMSGLGYPPYFVPFIGVAKILGVIGILIPGFPRIKEWSYAGLAFDLIGAAYSVMCVAGGIGWLFMVMLLALEAGSYIFYHKKLKGTA